MWSICEKHNILKMRFGQNRENISLQFYFETQTVRQVGRIDFMQTGPTNDFFFSIPGENASHARNGMISASRNFIEIIAAWRRVFSFCSVRWFYQDDEWHDNLPQDRGQHCDEIMSLLTVTRFGGRLCGSACTLPHCWTFTALPMCVGQREKKNSHTLLLILNIG